MEKLAIEYLSLEKIKPYLKKSRIKICKECERPFVIRQSVYNKRVTCSLKCAAKMRTRLFKGKNAPNWKGGKSINFLGWTWVYCPEHPKSHNNYVAEHRLIMEKEIGRRLESEEIVHHINGIKTDNRIENLELHNRSSHGMLHHPKGKRIGE